MAKRKTSFKVKLDVMSITVMLAIALFGGILGYYIGQSFGVTQALEITQTR